ncbi:MAG: response regulator [Phycisphaerales bacterium]|jgi:CheY-like chemotaxis protein|nr:response regulator [Phycisphaerales bacterium]
MNENQGDITILVVDDDIDVREQMQFQLEAAGYNVVTAEGQIPAEKLLETMKPDLAIVDLMMEHVDGGFALSYHIKKIDQNIPVLLITGVTAETGFEFDAQTAEEQSWIKADALLPKPIRYEQLIGKVKKLLNR